MVYDLLIVFSSPPIENNHIDEFMDLLIFITHIDKICDLVGQTFKFLCKLIVCEAQEIGGANYK